MTNLLRVAAFAVCAGLACAQDPKAAADVKPVSSPQVPTDPLGNSAGALGTAVVAAIGIGVWEYVRAQRRRKSGDAIVQVAEITASTQREKILWDKIGALEKRVDELENQRKVDYHELAKKEIEIAALKRTIADQEEQIRSLESELNAFRKAAAAAGGGR